MNNKKNYLLIISAIIVVVLLIVGTTYALWPWWSSENERTAVTFTITQNYSCSADGGGNITSEDVTIIPTNCTNDPYVIRRTITTNVTKTGTNHVFLDLWLDIKTLDQELSNTQNFMYVLTDSPTSCTSGNIIASGNFNGKLANQKIDLLVNDDYTQTENRTYYLYIWLDYAEKGNLTMNKNFHFELKGRCNHEDDIGTPNPPEVVDGLIPVKLSDKGDTVNTVAENDSSWYNYSQKKWANAVLVSEDTHPRSYYLSNPNTEVPEEDILAYYVWIPRYSYNVWQYEGIADTVQEREIDIKFVDTSTIEIATGNGEWYTHPAFWWDDDSDGVRDSGEELSGIWVGKFEVSHATLSNSGTTNNLGTDSGTICNSTSCNKYAGLRILPNVKSLRSNRISNFFNASRLMESSGNPFGLVASSVDSHMIKNNEWGAVAYLSHSKYGIDSEVRRNNQSVYFTGCGAATLNASYNATCSNKYADTVTVFPQSTTGNVTGIFDMSGGAYEYTMAHLGNTTDYGSSGFSSSYPLPDTKYYDNYSITSINSCTLATCGGHALNETKSWYSDNISFVTTNKPWFVRGGQYQVSSGSGTFCSHILSGGSDGGSSSRLVLIPE